MPDIDYENFDLLIDHLENDQYRAKVLYSPAGSGPECTFVLSKTDIEPYGLHNGGLLSDPASTRLLGQLLYARAFGGEVRNLMLSSLHMLQRQPRSGLRIRLRLSGVPALAGLPWEYLYVDELGQYLALSAQVALVHYLDVRRPVEPLHVRLPLRILVLISAPADFPLLDVTNEWRALEQSIQTLKEQAAIQVDKLELATFDQLRQALAQDEYHILHYIGHGGLDPQTQEGLLILEDGANQGQPISGSQLTQLLANKQTLKLVILNSCEGARASAANSFTGIAQSLVQGGIPAVIAMQAVITNEAATRFTPEFYKALASGKPVDAATTQARMAIFTQPNPLEWATPVLFMQSANGVIFTIEASPTSPPVQPNDANMPSVSTTGPGYLPLPLTKKTRAEQFSRWLSKLDPTQIAVAVITAIVGTILLYMVIGNNNPPPPPTATATIATVTVALNSLPTAIITASTPLTPTSGSVMVSTPTVEPRPPLRVGIANFASCADEQFATHLQTEIMTRLQRQKIAATDFLFTPLASISNQASALAQTDQDLVIWGECTQNNGVNYAVAFLRVGDGMERRIAEPEMIQLTGVPTTTDISVRTLAGILAYHGSSSTVEAAALLNQVSNEWAQSIEPLQQVNLRWLLGNAWFGHTDGMYTGAGEEYTSMLKQLESIENYPPALEAAIYNNLAWSYYYLQQYDEAVTEFSQAITLKSDYGRAYVGRSTSYLAMRNYKAALNDCIETIKRLGQYAPGYVCRSRVNQDSESSAILSDTKRAIEADVTYAPAYYFASVAYCKQDDRANAITNMKEFITKAQQMGRWEVSATWLETARRELVDIETKGCVR